MTQALPVTPSELLARFPSWQFNSIKMQGDDGSLRRLYLGIRWGEHMSGLSQQDKRLLRLISKPVHHVTVMSDCGLLGNVLAWNEFCRQVEAIG